MDLTAGQFCFVGCKAAQNITRVEPGTIVFIDKITNQGMDLTKLTVSRSDGTVFRLMVSRMQGTIDTYRGSCTVAPFTPPPKVLF